MVRVARKRAMKKLSILRDVKKSPPTFPYYERLSSGCVRGKIAGIFSWKIQTLNVKEGKL